MIGFYNYYSNLLGSDFAATGVTGSLNEFNASENSKNGIELLLYYELLPKSSNYMLPVTFGYTYTNTSFLNSFGSESDIWVEVSTSEELPHIPKHQFNAMLYLELTKYELNLRGRYNGEFRTLAGTGNILDNALVASNFIVDFSA